MADDIKIRVGVQSSVKADMDRLVADMNKGVASMPKATIGELLERGKVIDVWYDCGELRAEVKWNQNVPYPTVVPSYFLKSVTD